MQTTPLQVPNANFPDLTKKNGLAGKSSGGYLDNNEACLKKMKKTTVNIREVQVERLRHFGEVYPDNKYN